MPLTRPSRARVAALWTLVVLGGFIAIGAIGYDVLRREAGMQAATTTAAFVRDAKPGEPIQAVVRLDASAGTNTYSAQVLESTDGTNYRGTSERIRIGLGAETSVAMGAASDIKPGAVVQINGRMDAAHTLLASQVVILSGFVHLATGR